MEIKERINHIKNQLEEERIKDIEESMINHWNLYSPDFWDFERIMEENSIEGINLSSPSFIGFPEGSI